MFKKGDTVGLLDWKGYGTIIHVLENDRYLVLVEDEDMEMPLHERELYVLNQEVIQPIGKVPNWYKEPKAEVNRSIGKSKRMVTEEVDLHIEKIPTGFKRGLVDVEAQLNYCEHCLNAAISNRKQSIVFIHGKGNGILKSRLAKMLQNRKLTFHDPERELSKKDAKVFVRLK